MMNREQWLVLGSALMLFLVLYFGFDTRAFEHEEIPLEAREGPGDRIEWLLRKYRKQAMDSLGADNRDLIHAMEYRMQDAETDSLRVEEMKKLSGKWYDLGYLHLAGLYAERVAEIIPTDSSWAMAGTTYSLAMKNLSEPEWVELSAERARYALQQAISLDPDEVRHRINLALTYTIRPEANEPMKGVRMLLELNREHPDNVSVLTALGRLSFRTGQLDKAVERLERVLTLDSDHMKANCLLSAVYSEKGNFAVAKKYRERCLTLRSNE